MLTSNGVDCTPRGRKACALLAMLALSPDHKRSRVWLQDKLWGSRGPEQGAASLRQSLTEIRRALGDEHGFLLSDRFVLSLEKTRLELDLDRCSTEHTAAGAELLEGFDIGEDGFEDWLREERRKWHDRNVTRAPPIAPRLEENRAGGQFIQERFVLVRGQQNDQGELSILSDSVVDAIAKTIAELGAAKIIDRRSESDEQSGRQDEEPKTRALSLRADIFGSNTSQVVRLALLEESTNALAWANTLQTREGAKLDLADPAVMGFINRVVNVAIDQFARIHTSSTSRTASSALCYSGILHLFRLGNLNFRAADSLFAAAFEFEPRGVYLAWRAYLRTFLLAERQFTSRQTIEEEAFDFVRRALELEPHNSYVAALSAHVYSIMKRSYVAAYELAERSIQLNHVNPIGWACLGIAKSYLGKSEEGFRHTLLARDIAGSAPFRYQLDALSCVAGTMAGDLRQAAHLAESCHMLAPNFAPPLRYLSALYAHDRKYDLSLEMVRKLQVNEPDFSYDKLRDISYPAAGLHRTSIIKSLPRREV